MADTTLTGTLSTTFVDKPDDVLSAKTYADAAANAANAASTSENNAATSEANSKKSETAAKTSETNAASSATAAAQSESNASTYKDQTKSYADNASKSASAAAESAKSITEDKFYTQAEMDAKYLISETEPSNPNDGSLWFDTGNMLIKARINGAWVSFGAVYSG